MAHVNKNLDVLVSGASGMIGRAIAKRLARSGYRVHLAGRDKIAFPIYHFDLKDPASGERAVRRFFRNVRRPYALVCGAGHLGPVGPFWKTPIRAWRQSVLENFVSHASMVHAFASAMTGRKRRSGAIVVFSGAGIGGAGDFSNVSSYSASKAALVHLVEALAPELRHLGITINAIAPGPVLSAITRQTLRAAKECNPGFLKTAVECAKTGGVSPDLAAQLTDFLLSPGARHLTGRLLSARFDQAALRHKTRAVAQDADRFRMRRIDNALFRRTSA